MREIGSDHGHPLSHPAGKLVRKQPPGLPEPEAREQAARLIQRVGQRPPVDLRGKHRVPQRAAPREKRVTLREVGDLGEAGGVARNADGPAIWIDQARDDTQQRRLPAARGSEARRPRSTGERKRDPLENRRSVRRACVADRNAVD